MTEIAKSEVCEAAKALAEQMSDAADELGRHEYFPTDWAAREIQKVLNKLGLPNKEQSREIEELRRRVSDTEDALRREVRKNLRQT
jgi:polyhydroxyalkanoate synthesis regulator phasin